MDMLKNMVLTQNRNQNQADQPDESSWMISTLCKVTGTLAGIFGILGGLISLFSFSTKCIVAGALLAVEGFAVTLIEAPCFCIFLEFSSIPSAFFDSKAHYVRAVVYLMFSIIPFMFCVGFALFLGCGLMLITSGLYLMKSLGRKASRQEMQANAMLSTSPSAILVQNEQAMAGANHSASKFTGEIPTGITY